VGRALMDPLKDNGAEGVSKKIEDMTEELAGAMARTCSPDITGIDPSVILYR
jgi:isopentenyl diphosphate isomerase/L-lactate dehydrogenase-like FMN-dependent dehydrogenase